MASTDLSAGPAGVYDYSWVVGFAAGFLVYLVLALLMPARPAARTVAVPAARE